MVATLQNVVQGTEGNAQRFMNSGAWILVLMLILWILFIDREAKSPFKFTDTKDVGERILQALESQRRMIKESKRRREVTVEV